MTPVMADAVSLHALDHEQKMNMPVSIAIDGRGKRTIISRYGDDVWDFWPYITRENATDGEKRIIWAISLPDGTKLTDKKHRQLLIAAKDFVWSLHVNPINGHKRPSMKTLIGVIANLTFVLRWMVRNGMTRFAHLKGRGMEFVVAAKEGGAVTNTTVVKRLRLLENLHAQAGKIDDFLPEHPWPFESAALLAGVDQRTAHRTPKTRLIPDEVFIKLARKAIEYVDERADQILRDHHETEEAMALARANGVTGKCYSYVFGTRVARARGYAGIRELNLEKCLLRTACYICINMFSGLRDSEMMSLASNCITREPGTDGSYECIWLRGTIYKTGERPHKWLVPPIVERAVRVAERLAAPLQEILREQEADLVRAMKTVRNKDALALSRLLVAVRQDKDKLFLGMRDSQPGVLGGAAMSYRLKEFCANCEIRDKDGKVWDLASHQFRRTFAYNYAKSELGDLLYLKEHYGHWSLDMTLLYADGGADGYQVDNGLLEDVIRAKQERQAEILTNYLTSDVPLAKGEDWLGAWRPMVRTAKNKEEFVKELSSTLSLNGTGHSWCAGNAKGGNCGGLCVHEADMCVDCNAALIGPEHLPVWKEIAAQQEAVIALEDVGALGKARARRILGKANEVIARLEGGRRGLT